MIVKNTFYKQIYNIFTLKSVFQIIDLLFKYLIIKRFSMSDLGVFLYVCSIIYFLSNTSLMGMSIYMQRQIARNNSLNFRYIMVVLLFLLVSCVFAYIILPQQLMALKPYFIVILICNTIVSMVIAVCYGSGRYDNRYKILLVSCGYMVALIFYMLYKKNHYDLNLIFYSWVANAVIATIYSIGVFLPLRNKISFMKEPLVRSSTIMLNLILIYAVSMPFDYARFYDRFLLNHFFNSRILGMYSFNCSMMLAAYSFLIMPIISICMTSLSKNFANIERQAKIIFRFYIYTLFIFALIFIVYVPFAHKWLIWLGLIKYSDTVGVFIFVYLNMFIYALSIPFIIRISISDNNKEKFFYCLFSIAIFNIPMLFIIINPGFITFLSGFLVAYTFHLLLSVGLNYAYSKELIQSLRKEGSKLVNSGRAGILALISE